MQHYTQRCNCQGGDYLTKRDCLTMHGAGMARACAPWQGMKHCLRSACFLAFLFPGVAGVTKLMHAAALLGNKQYPYTVVGSNSSMLCMLARHLPAAKVSVLASSRAGARHAPNRDAYTLVP